MFIALLVVCSIIFLITMTSVFYVIKKSKQKPALEIDLLQRFMKYPYYYQHSNNTRASASVAEKFRDIPKNYRPFSSNELARTLTALDIKWGDRANEHEHRIRWFDGTHNQFLCTCSCVSSWYRLESIKDKCPLWHDYGRLVWEFNTIIEAAKEQEKQFKLAGMVEASPEHLHRLLERAREESAIIIQVTGELLGEPGSADNSEELTTVAHRVREKVKALGARHGMA